MIDAQSAHFDDVFGTILDVQWTAERDTEDPASRLEDAVLSEIGRLERILSTRRADTELSYWLETRGENMPVSTDLAHVLSAALNWCAVTDGAFDPAYAGSGGRPTPTDPNAPPWSVGRDGARHTALKRTTDPLTFDAVAKGYVADRTAESASAVPGVRDVIVALGGDIRHVGPGKVVLGVTDPSSDAQDGGPSIRLEISGHGVATSGSHRRGERRDGVWHSHLIDPSTGRSIDRNVSATVIAPLAEDADALATAFAVLDPETSVAIADSVPDVACLVVDDDRGRFENARWARYEIPAPAEPPGRPMSRRQMFTRFLPAWPAALALRPRGDARLFHP